MARWHDEYAINCLNCGWLTAGRYTDGMPYVSCGRWGYILYEQSEEVCNDWMTKEEVEAFMKKDTDNKKRKRKC
jgi:hypothetical protein